MAIGRCDIGLSADVLARSRLRCTPGNLLGLTTSEFYYENLESTKHFRLVRVLPGNWSDGLTCILIPFLVEKSPPYLALSYTWGYSSNSHAIALNGKSFRTSSNVGNFLHRVRHPVKSTSIWIDVICINQADNKEKESQIQMMGKIYHVATNVVVWLGECPDAQAAMNLVRKLGNRMATASPLWIMDPLRRITRTLWAVIPKHFQNKFFMNLAEPARTLFVRTWPYIPWQILSRLLTPVATLRWFLSSRLPEPKEISSDWPALIKLLHHPWFERVWVIQKWLALHQLSSCTDLSKSPRMSSYLSSRGSAPHGCRNRCLP